MATTPGSYGRFIGRVGALAVALGVGAAIANGAGIALADEGTGTTSPGDPGPSTADSPTTDGTPPGSVSGLDDANDTDPDAGDGSDDGEEPDEIADADEGDDVVAIDEPSNSGSTDKSPADDLDSSAPEFASLSRLDTTSTVDVDVDVDDTEIPTAPEQPAGGAADEPSAEAVQLNATQTSETLTLDSVTTEPITPPPTAVTTGLGGLVSGFLSVLGLGPRAASAPVAPPQPPLLWALLGWARREIGTVVAPFTAVASAPVAALLTADAPATAVSPLATPGQLAAERIAAQTARTLPVALMKIFLRQGFLNAAKQQYPHGLDAGSLAALDNAVDEYAMAAAFQQQLLNSMTPTVVTQVAPPHIWFGQSVPGSRILYDNPDTIYNFMGVNGASEYVIRGQFRNWSNEAARPSDTTFSVLEGVGGTTSTLLTVDENFEVDEDGNFVITVSAEPADGRANHLQLTPGSTIIAARNTLGDWTVEEPMSLSIERVGGPPNSLFAQLGGFTFLGQQVAGNPLLTTLVSLVPPLPVMPPTLRGVFTAAILVVRGVGEQSKYMALASTDPATGQPRPANVLSEPASNAEFLANQLQSNGHFELADDEALVLVIDPGRAGYFIVPTYNIWTITGDYWNQQTSLNNEQAVADDGTGTYTIVISPTDPGVTNWVSTGGLNQGVISMRFQNLAPDPDDENAPRILSQQVIPVADAKALFPDDPRYFVDRAEQLAARKAGFDKRWAPYPQP
ncbi:hypothetical protein [Mycolicibacterium sp. XJ1819]